MKQNENGKKIKENIRNQMRRIGSWKSWSKKRKVTTGVCGVCVIAVVAGAIGLSGGSDTEVIYKETTVKYGTLVIILVSALFERIVLFLISRLCPQKGEVAHETTDP